MRAGTRLALFALLFAQAAVAVSACLRPLSAPAVGGMQPSAHCEAQQKANLNLCFYHCADQSDQHAPQPVIPAATTPILTLAQPAFVADTSCGRRDAVTAIHDPPIAVRFCSFQI